MSDTAASLRLMLKVFRMDPRNAVLIEQAADELDQLYEAVDYAHSEGFEWPSDPIPQTPKQTTIEQI